MNLNREYKYIELLEKNPTKLSRLEFLAKVHNDKKIVVLLKNFVLPYRHPNEIHYVLNILEDEEISFYDWGDTKDSFNELYLLT